MVTGHGCESNPSHIAATAMRNEEKRLATTTTMRTGEILANVRNKVRISGVQDELPKVKARKRGIQRARTDSEDCKPPAIPTCLESITIPEAYRVYEAVYGREPDKWLLADSGYNKVIGGRIFIFGRKSYTQWMSTVRNVFVDGTFRISPPLFEQCRKIVALACVPILHLDECFALLKKNLPASLSSILDWFENYYLGPMQPNGIRKTARFPIDSWNLVQRIEEGENRTNNYAEAHHRKVACELGVCHPNLWRFIDSMKLVQRGIDEAYNEMVLGHEPPIKPKKYRMADERMLTLVKQAVKAWEEIVPMDYLSGIAYNFRMAQGPYQLPEAQEEEELLIVNKQVREDKRNHAGDVLDLSQLDEQIIITRFGIDLTRKDLNRLKPGCWINDNLVNFYLELIKRRSILDSYLTKVIVYSTQFYQKLSGNRSSSVKEWNEKEDIFACDVLLIPIHRADHWALVVVRMKKQRLLYYDSLHGDGSSCLTLIKEYLQVKSSMYQHSTMDPINWLGLNDKSVPRQTNGCDCGVFVCQFAMSASLEIRPSFQQEDMEHIRKEMFQELQVGKLSRKKEIS